VTEVLYSPSPVQREFHLCRADEALLGGAGGPGKSLALLMDPIETQLPIEHQRWKQGETDESQGWAIHFRREYPMLAETIDRAHRIFPRIDSGVKWDGDARLFRFSCGYKYQFGHLREALDWRIYDSRQFTHIGFDELWQFEEEQYMRLARRCRTSDPVLLKLRRIRSATIPAGNWVRRYFVDPCPKGRTLLVNKLRLDDGTEAERSRVFIPARLSDNPDVAFRRDYEANLRDSPTHIRLALLDGDWYAVAGAFFAEEWRPERHVVAPFKVPPGWYRFRSGDWGYKNPTVVLWWAADSDDNLVCYRERTWKRMDAGAVALAIKETETEAGEWDDAKDCSRLSGPMDTQIWEQRGTIGPTIFETMSAGGVWWDKCTKNRLQSVQQFIGRLKDDQGEVPAIRFFDTCTETIRTIPAIATSGTNPELPEDGGDDHWLDAVLYACMSRMGKGAKDERTPVWQEYDDEMAHARRKHLRQRQQGRYGYGSW